VIYDRVEALTARSQSSAANMLDDVIAHELGHLMIPGPGHTTRGIMQSGLNVHVHPMETFTGPQARQIVSGLVGKVDRPGRPGEYNGTTRTIAMNQPNDRTTYRS
jgi:hypothetical protein